MDSLSTIHEGIFTNDIGNVSVHPVAAMLPTVIRERHWFPVEVGEVPHDEIAGIVPVASQYPVIDEEATQTSELGPVQSPPIQVLLELITVDVVVGCEMFELPRAEPDVAIGIVFAIKTDEVVTVPGLVEVVNVVQVTVPVAETAETP